VRAADDVGPVVTRVIRVDATVRGELERRRLPGERNPNGAIRRALEEAALEERLTRYGLTTAEMARLVDLRGMRS
jgi:hypothetical protein